MTCGWCGEPAEGEYVDVGVGSVQVAAAVCGACGASQMSGYGEDKADATPEENRRRWWMGPETEWFMVHLLETDEWFNEREWITHLFGRADSDPHAYMFNERPRVSDLMGVVHSTYVEYEGRQYVFRTHCGRDLVVAGSGPLPTVTCVVCAASTRS